MDAGHWNIDAVGEFNPTDFFGFVYLIEQRSTGKAYVGKKFFLHKRQKTKSNKSRTKESDWKTYTSSSALLNDLIAEHGKGDFTFTILKLCSGRCELTYTEQELQYAHDVLRARLPNGERKYFNMTIGHLNFAGIEKQTQQTRDKLSHNHVIP